MANTLNIQEVTMAQLADETHAINVITPDGTGIGRYSKYETLTVRVTDHVSNDAGETGDDTTKMALFVSKKIGDPWLKDANVLQSTIFAPANGATPVPTAEDKKANTVFVNYAVTN